MNLLEKVKLEALNGNPCSIEDAIKISKSFDINDICDAADEIRKKWNGDNMDTCSIVNARSGKCSENCKWCAQSRFYETGCKEYDIIPHEEVMKALKREFDVFHSLPAAEKLLLRILSVSAKYSVTPPRCLQYLFVHLWDFLLKKNFRNLKMQE